MKKNFIIIFSFAFFSFKVFSFELNFDFTNIWNNSSGKAINYNAELFQKINCKNNQFRFGGNFSNSKSTLKFLNTDLYNENLFFSYKSNIFDLQITLGFNNSKETFLEINKKEFSLEKFFNYYFKQELSFKICDFQIKPFFLCSSINQTDGEFYWFNGSLNVPLIKKFGLQWDFYNNKFLFSYSDFTLNIFNTESVSLGNATVNNFYALYAYDLKINNFFLKPFISYNYLFLNFDVSLTKDNQKFLFFPYIYCNIDGNIFAHIFNLGLDFNFTKNKVNFKSKLNSYLILHQDGTYLLDWKYKKNFMFDGTSGFEYSKIDDFNLLGLVNFLVKLEYTFNIKKLYLNLYCSKNFIFPFSLEYEFNIDELLTTENIKSWLFSCFNIGIKIFL